MCSSNAGDLGSTQVSRGVPPRAVHPYIDTNGFPFCYIVWVLYEEEENQRSIFATNRAFMMDLPRVRHGLRSMYNLLTCRTCERCAIQ
jgi:hypothetical protein